MRFRRPTVNRIIENKNLKNKKDRDSSVTVFSFLVQKKGVEPSRYCYHTDLNRARLPIPPLLQTVAPARCPPNQRMILYRVSVKKSTIFFPTLTIFEYFLRVTHRVFPLSGSILSIGNCPVCKPAERNRTPDHRNAKDRRKCKGNDHADA